jgi:hypothetical protein
VIPEYHLSDLAEMRGAAWIAAARPSCAYFRGIGICSFGCWEEPTCYVDEPGGSWEQEAYKRYIDLAETLRAIAREDRADLTHADVKNLRDQARQAQRQAVRCLELAAGAS